METEISSFYGSFILTLAGFVLPILTISLSAFPEGVKKLRQDYENEQKQAEKNLADELQKQKLEKELDYDMLVKNIASLKSTKKRAEKSLLYLNPNYILAKSAIAIGISFLLFLIGLSFYDFRWYIPTMFFVASIIFFIWIIIIFFNSIRIIIEASSAVQSMQRTREEKIVELLATLVDNSKKGDPSLFIEHKYIHVFFHNEEVKPAKEYTFSANKKYTINISLENLSEYMLKTAELGFTFPAEFLIEGDSISSTYTGDKEKIIRFKHDHLQANVNQLEGDVSITFLKVGVFDIDTFVKGENLKNKTIKFKIKVIS